MTNNKINTLSQGLLLGWGNYALQLPYIYGDNINNTFANNQITGSQISPLTLSSALGVNVANNAFTDVMCGVFGDNTRQFGWEAQNTPFNMAFVYGIIFSGNTITTTSACPRNLVNYAVSSSLSPVSLKPALACPVLSRSFAGKLLCLGFSRL